MLANSQQECSVSTSASLERTRFFPRQLVTPDDLTQDQLYAREKLRLHNRMLHGWGVVCGARVQLGKEKCSLVIEAGYVLGPQGDDIVINSNITINACNEDLDGNLMSACGEPQDPWCRDVRADRQAGQVYYLAVRYAECLSRPVRSQPGGCGCDDDACEYSRIRDSFELKLLRRLPEAYTKMQPPNLRDVFECNRDNQLPGCPTCPPDPWVILADVTFQADGSLAVDCFTHRRSVISFADYFIMCRDETNTGAYALGDRPIPQKTYAAQLVESRAAAYTRDQAARINSELSRMLDTKAIQALDLAAASGTAYPQQLLERPAAEIKGLGQRSYLGKTLREQNLTIGEIANQSQEVFVNGMVAKARADQKEAVRKQAASVYDTAKRISELIQD